MLFIYKVLDDDDDEEEESLERVEVPSATGKNFY